MKYNLGIGIDIENVERFNNINKIKNRNFLHKIYTPNELEYCFSGNNFAEKLAIYFCGKESLIKALSSIGYNDIYRNNIHISEKMFNVFEVKLLQKPSNIKLSISLSMNESKAIAYAIAIIR